MERQETTRVLLVGLDTGKGADFEHSMEELKSLVEAADKQVAGIAVQRMENVNKDLYIGSGKVAEVREYAGECEADDVVFDDAEKRSRSGVLQVALISHTNAGKSTLMNRMVDLYGEKREKRWGDCRDPKGAGCGRYTADRSFQ